METVSTWNGCRLLGLGCRKPLLLFHTLRRILFCNQVDGIIQASLHTNTVTRFQILRCQWFEWRVVAWLVSQHVPKYSCLRVKLLGWMEGGRSSPNICAHTHHSRLLPFLAVVIIASAHFTFWQRLQFCIECVVKLIEIKHLNLNLNHWWPAQAGIWRFASLFTWQGSQTLGRSPWAEGSKSCSRSLADLEWWHQWG